MCISGSDIAPARVICTRYAKKSRQPQRWQDFYIWIFLCTQKVRKFQLTPTPTYGAVLTTPPLIYAP